MELEILNSAMRTVEELLFELVWESVSVRCKGWTVALMDVCFPDLLSRGPDARRVVHPSTTACSDMPQLSLRAHSLPSLGPAND